MTTYTGGWLGDGTPGNPYRPKATRYPMDWNGSDAKHYNEGNTSLSATPEKLVSNWLAADPTFDSDPPTTIYVDDAGVDTAVGSLAAPVDLQTALNSSYVYKATNTVILEEGIYAEDIVINIPNIIFKGNPGMAVHGSVYVSKGSVIVRDLEIYDADFTNRESAYGGSTPPDIPLHDGARPQIAGVKFINCIIHDTRQGILSAGIPNIEINGCVIYNVGWNNSQRGSGHGIYFSSDGTNPGVTVKDCIVCNTFGFGLHGYGEGAPASLFYMTVEGNTVFNGGILSGLIDTNILVGGTGGCYTRYSNIKNNMTYYAGNAGTNQIGFGLTGPYDTEIKDNIFVGGQYSLKTPDNGTGLTVTGNKFHGPLNSAIISADTFPDNEYTSGVPDLVYVRPNDYQTDRANVTVYNGSSANTVSVNLTAVTGLGVGDNVTVANVQDYFVDIQTLTLDADKKIVVDMQAVNRSVATPQGWTAPATTFPQFGAFVVEKA